MKDVNSVIKAIVEYMEDPQNDNVLECRVGNCKIICYGYSCGTECAGEVHFADAETFDRWSNSRGDVVNYANSTAKDGHFEKILRMVIRVYE